MDRILKEYFDLCRVKGYLPEELNGEIKGRLFDDMEKLKEWRNAFKGLRFIDEKTGSVLRGAIDDLFVTSEGVYVPIDFKTRSSAPTEDTLKTVQHQMDIYCFLLEKNGMKAADFAFLIYYYPKKCETFGSIKFGIELVKLRTNKERGGKIFTDALKLLEGEEPECTPNCAYCKFREGY
jgi:CRISPR/Cas system-associated exonuclease Cas4 (RecB family)